jgi:hypothetical protein
MIEAHPLKQLLLAGLLMVALVSAALAEPLPAPRDLTVINQNGLFQGRWQAVPGASHYEVWTRLYGNWKFNEKDFNATPFTSSFELPGNDDRMTFKVRAVSPNGQKGAFSEEVRATMSAEPEPISQDSGTRQGVPDDFDPQAAPPAAPSSLFAVWSEPREIRLVWQASEKAARYTVEEFKDGKWVGVIDLEFVKETTAIIKDKPMPGPYQFRVRAIGRNGRASEPSRATTAKR